MARSLGSHERLLYVGIRRAGFLARADEHNADTTVVTTLDDEQLRGQVFDAAYVRSIVMASDEEIDRWSLRLREVLSPCGRLIVAVQSVYRDAEWVMFSAGSARDDLTLKRLTNPYSAVERLVANGFGVTEKHRHWATSAEVLVLHRSESSRRDVLAGHGSA